MSMRSRYLGLVFAGLATLGMAAAANAAPILSFDDGAVVNQDGTLSYAGGAAALVGSGIDFTTISAMDTPLNTGVVLTCTGCELNFTTGANLTGAPVYTFAAGGTFTVTGSVFQGLTLIASGTLVSGTFGEISAAVNGGSFINFVGSGLDTKNEDLLAFYGITSNNFEFANSEISGDITRGAGGSFTSNVINADLDNTNIVAVPEPASLAILGAGLLGLGMVRRRRKVAA